MQQQSHVDTISGVHGTQHSSAHASHSADPFANIRRNDSKGGEGGYIGDIFFHRQIQRYEEQLQFLNSNKADMAGTSVGISETKLRFMSFIAGHVIFVSLCSLLVGMIVFALFLQATGQYLIAYLILGIFLSHTFFPGYVVYLMKRHVSSKKFTGRFHKKILSAWHAFELTYILNIVGVYFMSLINWISIKEQLLLKIESKTSILNKFYKFVVNKINFESIAPVMEHLTVGLLFFFIIYMVLAYITNKRAVVEQEVNTFEHNKERLRPIQLARIKAGKFKMD